MKKVSAFPSSFQTPRQAMLHAEDELDEMEEVAIIYFRKGDDSPRLTCSSMGAVELHFLGSALSHYAMHFMKE